MKWIENQTKNDWVFCEKNWEKYCQLNRETKERKWSIIGKKEEEEEENMKQIEKQWKRIIQKQCMFMMRVVLWVISMKSQ